MPAYIDLPHDRIETPVIAIAGWVAARSPPRAITIAVNGTAIPHQVISRPDVRDAMPDFAFTSGVAAAINLLSLPPAIHLDVAIDIDGDKATRRLGVTDSLYAHWSDDGAIRAANRSFCLARLICPACHAGTASLDIRPRMIKCHACNTEFPQTGFGLDMISGKLAIEANLAATANISANPYTPEALALIERVTSAHGTVLDCGAGSRPRRTRGVVNVEIVDYASTDVLAIGESLPFADASFDGAVSLAVLEHVRDPFRCAKELLRVVKPGGELLIDVPFLQPVHGYPHHYYNMTAQGLTNLFGDGAQVLSCTVPLHGHPIFGVQWQLRDYLTGLPEDVAARFGAMTVNDLVALDIPAFLADPRALSLSESARSTIACLNSLHIRKS
ncbi:MAG TPA: methyltransferase domain-containing protein [Acidiphilium sp.]